MVFQRDCKMIMVVNLRNKHIKKYCLNNKTKMLRCRTYNPKVQGVLQSNIYFDMLHQKRSK